MDSNVNIKISIDSKNAEANVKSLGTSGTKATNDLTVGLTSVTSAFKVFQGVLSANIVTSSLGLMADAYREFISIAKESISEAVAQEKANTLLAYSMKTMGDYTDKSYQSMQDLATQMAETTKYTDDQIVSSLNSAKAFGLTNDQAKKVIKSAADLATIKDIPLDQAVEVLAKSLQGAGGQLERMVPALRNTSDAAYKAGAGLEYVSRNFGGASSSQLNTYEGSLNQANKAFGEMLETVGMIITKNPDVIRAIKDITSVIVSMTKTIADNAVYLSQMLSDSINGVRDSYSSIKDEIKENIRLTQASDEEKKKYIETEWQLMSTIEKTAEVFSVFIGLYGAYLVATSGAFAGATVAAWSFAAGLGAVSIAAAPVIITVGAIVAAVAALSYGIVKLIDYVSGTTEALNKMEEANAAFSAQKTGMIDYRSEMDKNTDTMLAQLGILKEFSFYPEELKKKVLIENASVKTVTQNKTESPYKTEEDQAKANAEIALQIERDTQSKLAALRKTARDEIALQNAEAEDLARLEKAAREDEDFAESIAKQEKFFQDKREIENKYDSERYKILSKGDKDEEKRTVAKNKFLVDQNKKRLEQEKAIDQSRIEATAKINQAQMDGGFMVANALVQASGMGAAASFAITKALMIGQTIMNGYAAMTLAMATIPPPAGEIVGASLLTTAYVNAAAIAAVGMIQLAAGQGAKGGYEHGGIVPGSSFTGDRITARVNSGEMILNKQQQTSLFQQINSGSNNSTDNAGIVSAIKDAIASINITLVADDKAIAKSANRGYADGIAFGRA